MHAKKKEHFSAIHIAKPRHKRLIEKQCADALARSVYLWPSVFCVYLRQRISPKTSAELLVRGNIKNFTCGRSRKFPRDPLALHLEPHAFSRGFTEALLSETPKETQVNVNTRSAKFEEEMFADRMGPFERFAIEHTRLKEPTLRRRYRDHLPRKIALKIVGELMNRMTLGHIGPIGRKRARVNWASVNRFLRAIREALYTLRPCLGISRRC